ncbi:nitroreductase family protein [Diaphorobacter sp.]|uniref:nitroreductase family protein n=1 Tax=Diaphorobacter sp. TaxID=1934310 RepID=UPI003D0F77AF
MRHIHSQDHAQTQAAAAQASTAELVSALVQARQTILPKRLGGPGPDAAQLQAILAAAGHAPDHGCLLPWRFILVPQQARAALGDAFAQALLERDPLAAAAQQEQAREKAFRAPVLLLAVVDEQCGDPEITPSERMVSAGCAVQNLLLMATAQGFGSALTSGKALHSHALRTLFALRGSERALCFVSLGSVVSRKPVRPRPMPAHYIGTLVPGQGVQPWTS